KERGASLFGKGEAPDGRQFISEYQRFTAVRCFAPTNIFKKIRCTQGKAQESAEGSSTIAQILAKIDFVEIAITVGFTV
ncbi:hypothetical protein, partial [Microcoleus sp. herbarium12]|uniref:hypothetical protein n=1 Tax=Microcoleus sp. herbarium12 TaxID=3055437 RepID=UPI002FD185C1